MELVQPSIYICNIRLDEPVTTITDLVVSVMCFYAFYQLNSIPKKNKVHWNLKYYFLSMGLATLIGGVIGHGFLYLFSFAWKLPGWLTSMFSIALLERASILYAKPSINRKTFSIPDSKESSSQMSMDMSSVGLTEVPVFSEKWTLFL